MDPDLTGMLPTVFNIPPPAIQHMLPTDPLERPLLEHAWETGNGLVWRGLRKPWQLAIAPQDRDYFMEWTAANKQELQGERDWLIYGLERSFLFNVPGLAGRRSSVYLITFRKKLDSDGRELWPETGLEEYYNAEDEGYWSDGDAGDHQLDMPVGQPGARGRHWAMECVECIVLFGTVILIFIWGGPTLLADE
ncbi:hypothetical protein BV25DRAFT_1921469 [Artomyces pyxidatus]|uniref:Uncharacterized protein n=1 Tax=Artomyces pyxidatus TaxID=48021 RepID=A0ACB8SJ82_9AGAM|nr:hypothetical protein BV25DRAFT_1921469 [Artomyces pyxidatus]